MKTASIVLGIVLCAMVSNAQVVASEHMYFTDAAKYGQNTIVQAEKGYANSLQSDNDGVVESALAHVTMLKITLPAREFKGIESEISKLVKKASTPELRYKAYLTLVAMQHPEIFRNVAQKEYSKSEQLFEAMSSCLCNYSSAR